MTREHHFANSKNSNNNNKNKYEQKQPLMRSVQKGVFKKSSDFTGKHLRWSLFLIKLQASKLSSYRKQSIDLLCNSTD